MKYKLNEDLFDDVIEIEVPSVEVEPITSDDTILNGPEPGEDTGKSSMILDAISNCAKTIDQYNILKTNLNDSSMSAAIDKILETENITLGRLQSLLKKVSPNAENIMVGAVETDNALGESLNESKKDKLKKEIFDFLDDCGGYTDYNQKVEDVMDEWNLDRDTAEGYVWNWSLKYDDDFDESLNEDWKDGEITDEEIKDWDWKMTNTVYQVERSIKTMLKKYPAYRDQILSTAKGCRNILHNLCSLYNESLTEDYDSHLVSYIENFFKDLTEEGDYRGYTIKDIRNALKELFPDIVFTRNESLNEAEWKDEKGIWNPSTLKYKGFKIRVGKNNLLNIYDKHNELVDSGFKTKQSVIDAIDSGEYDGLNEAKLNEGDWEDPEWRKYYGVDDDSFYDDLPIELEPEETFDDIDEDVPGGRFWEPGWEDANKNINADDDEEEVPELPFESLTKTVPPFTKLKVQTANTNTTEDYKVSNMLENMLNDNSYEIDDTI